MSNAVKRAELRLECCKAIRDILGNRMDVTRALWNANPPAASTPEYQDARMAWLRSDLEAKLAELDMEEAKSADPP